MGRLKLIRSYNIRRTSTRGTNGRKKKTPPNDSGAVGARGSDSPKNQAAAAIGGRSEICPVVEHSGMMANHAAACAGRIRFR